MSYTEPSNLEHKEIVLIYIAGKTSEAKGVEALLTDNEVTYTLMHTPFLRSDLFGQPIELPGVGFYVLSGQAEYCRDLLYSNKFRVGIVAEGEE